MQKFIALSFLAAPAAAGTWTKPGDIASAVVGVGAASADTAYIAAGSNGAGGK